MTRCDYYVLRNEIILFVVVGIFAALVSGSILVFTVEIVREFRGDDSWPSGLFLAFLIFYFLSALWRYRSQQRAERLRLEDEEDAFFESYS